ncbi:hypothetical protein Bca4012_021224 [Brassica carinata]|uniref:Uncharacterized protein n=1 Tax=Brassica carinata TaxID=52824 RepID=A0A8X7WHZ2_BRACI|nr:hypothetical protein Bca52824_000355 [Brassica carinata]
MDAKITEIKFKFCNALINGETVHAAYNHANKSGLEDNVFEAAAAPILELVETSIMRSDQWLNHVSRPVFLRSIPEAEKEADEALKESEKALERMQVAVTAATERKNARKEGRKKDEAKEQARKKTKVGEASNKPGGSNA